MHRELHPIATSTLQSLVATDGGVTLDSEAVRRALAPFEKNGGLASALMALVELAFVLDREGRGVVAAQIRAVASEFKGSLSRETAGKEAGVADRRRVERQRFARFSGQAAPGVLRAPAPRGGLTVADLMPPRRIAAR